MSQIFKSIPVLCYLLALFSSLPGKAEGNPLTKMQYIQLRSLLEEKIQEEYPSDDADYYADVLKQEPYPKKNLTYYHAGDPKSPVFISFGTANQGQKVHVLLRGEDYINPKDRNNFVVLRQTSQPDVYSVHIAHLTDILNIKSSKVIWNDGRIEIQKNLGKILDNLGNPEVQSRALRSKRTRCDWIGYWLLCEGTKYVKPMRPREPRKPLDEVDSEPVRPAALSEEEGTGGSEGGKTKRHITELFQKIEENRVQQKEPPRQVVTKKKEEPEAQLSEVPAPSNRAPVVEADEDNDDGDEGDRKSGGRKKSKHHRSHKRSRKSD